MAATPTIAPIPPDTLVRLDPERLTEEGRFELSREPILITATPGRIWILEDSLVEAVAIDTGHIERVGIPPTVCAMGPSGDGIVLGDCVEHRLYRVTSDLRVVRLYDLPRFGDNMAIASSSRGLWVLMNRPDPPEDRIYRLDPDTGEVLGYEVLPGTGNDSFELIEAGAYLWTFNFDDGSILRIAPSTLETSVTEEATRPHSIAASDRSVWISDVGPGEIIQFDQSGEVLDRVPQDGVLTGASDGVWVLDLDRLYKVGEEATIRQQTTLRYTDSGSFGNPSVAAGGSFWIGVRPADEF